MHDDSLNEKENDVKNENQHDYEKNIILNGFCFLLAPDSGTDGV